MDAVSRKFLPADRLRAKRRKTQLYEMDKAVEIQRLRCRSVVQAAALSGRDGATSSKVDGSTWRYNPKEDRVSTELLTKQEEYDEVVKNILDKKRPTPLVVAIDRDEEDGLDRQEIYLWLAFPPPSPVADDGADAKSSTSSSSSTKGWRRIQLPLTPFLTTLSTAFEDQMTSTALCFVTDASSALSSAVFRHVFDGSDTGLALVKEPSWMVVVARIVQKNLIKRENVVKILFALCRLEAWRAREKVGAY